MPVAQRLNGKFSYDDYLRWPSGERWELIDGEGYDMTPAPSFGHQRIAIRIVTLLETRLQGGECVVGVAPLDVVLSDHDVVQPDVFVVCDRSKITGAGIRGAPDLAVEILSPSTALKDRREKRVLYQRYGVREYLLVDPEGGYVEHLVLGEDGSYGTRAVLGPTDTIVLQSLNGLEIHLADVFPVDPAAEAHSRRTP